MVGGFFAYIHIILRGYWRYCHPLGQVEYAKLDNPSTEPYARKVKGVKCVSNAALPQVPVAGGLRMLIMMVINLITAITMLIMMILELVG